MDIYEFAFKLSVETEISYRNVKMLVKQIPLGYLNESIEWYKKYGLRQLKNFIKGLNL
ncbi:hypothetical protein [Clostridium senegalense]|uniref:hypothetical protein n=1 Tax=Clostridium senegalense TaxID=1465809 RepID=UPI00031BFE83|nr:hypothetical protein [Clostridium senegalense]